MGRSCSAMWSAIHVQAKLVVMTLISVRSGGMQCIPKGAEGVRLWPPPAGKAPDREAHEQPLLRHCLAWVLQSPGHCCTGHLWSGLVGTCFNMHFRSGFGINLNVESNHDHNCSTIRNLIGFGCVLRVFRACMGSYGMGLGFCAFFNGSLSQSLGNCCTVHPLRISRQLLQSASLERIWNKFGCREQPRSQF